MAETPDFEQLARQLVDRVPLIDVNWKRYTVANIAEQLRLVWNARGAADIAKLEELQVIPDDVSDDALRSLDR